MKYLSRLTVVGFCVFGLFGCGDAGPKTYAVKGKVTYKDQPVEGAAVTFIPAGTTSVNPAVGHTNAQGEFQLTTFNPGDGALAGDYVVSIAKSESTIQPQGSAPAAGAGKDKSLNMESMKKANEEMMQKVKGSGGEKQFMAKTTAKQLLPTKYSKRESSPLKATVKTDIKSNDFPFPLAD